MGQVHAGLAKHGNTWYTHEQTEGKGQRGKHWITTPGQNILQSIVIEPSITDITKTFRLSVVVSLGCYDFFKKYAGDDTFIKWPNDLYWRDRKAGGILIENLYRASVWKFAIVGIGININQEIFDPGIPHAISLKQITQKEMDAVALGKELCTSIEKRLRENRKNGSSTMDVYNSILYKRGQLVKLKKENMVFQTTITGVNEAGQLVTKDVIERTFDFGEVELMR